jgi:two-component system OmpR family sensor kinase
VGRLFWKCFLLIAIVQICSDQAVHIWVIHHYPREAEIYDASATPRGALNPEDMQSRSAETVRQAKHPTFNPPILVDVVASLGCAALLAWLLAKPISNLRSALSDAAGGNLDIRVADRMGFGNDELKDLGTEFDRMMSRLQALITAQRRLLHDVSHEIRSPMARIQAAIGLAHRQPEQALPLMERIERECVRVDRLVGEMLALSRLQAGVDNRLSEEFDVHELLSDIIDDARFEATAKERSISVKSEVHGSIRGNVDLLRRAVDNVLRNAIKFSKRGTVITLETAVGSEGGSVVISVQDAGTGVPESDLERIFEPFFRSPIHAQQDGSGLGLQIAKRVVQSHGGTIMAENVPTGGLRVNIELPLSC